MPEPNGQDWQRLARLVIHRRVELGHARQTGFADASGIKIRTLNNIENARSTGYDPATIARLEQALHWEPGSVEAVLAGGEARVSEPTVDELKLARAVLIQAMRLDDPEEMRDALADVLALVARAMEHGRYNETG